MGQVESQVVLLGISDAEIETPDGEDGIAWAMSSNCGFNCGLNGGFNCGCNYG